MYKVQCSGGVHQRMQLEAACAVLERLTATFGSVGQSE
jgi:hypothetical protein